MSLICPRFITRFFRTCTPGLDSSGQAICPSAGRRPVRRQCWNVTRPLARSAHSGATTRRLQADRFAGRAAFYLGELNTIHPLRDDNGRTPREFIRTLGLQAGHKVRWAPISKFEMISASKRSFATNRPNALVYVMRKAIGLSH